MSEIQTQSEASTEEISQLSHPLSPTDIPPTAPRPAESTNASAQPDEQLKSRKRITKEFIKKLLRSDIKQYYCTPELNDILYLHYKGFDAIENLEEFSELKVLYLEGNCISRIENLSNKAKLRALYLQENLISKIEGLDYLDSLVTLNLNDNFITTVEGLDRNKELESMQLKRNKIGVNGLSDLLHLTRLKKLSSLDISNNFIDGDAEEYIKILEQCPSLAVLYMQNNPICNKISNYRKTLIARLKNLKYLDDRPVFPEDRIFAEAFHFHGIEAERKAREEWKKEEEQRHWKNHEAFKAMLYGPRRQSASDQVQDQQTEGQPEQTTYQQLNTASQVQRREEELRRQQQAEKEAAELQAGQNDSSLSHSTHTSKLETYYSQSELLSHKENKEDNSLHNNDDSLAHSAAQNDKSIDDSMSLKSDNKDVKSLQIIDFDALDWLFS